MTRILLALVGFLAGWLLGTRQKQLPDTQDAQRAEQTATILTAIEERTALIAEPVDELRATASALRDGAAALDKQLGRVGREQFKANTLEEAQQRQAHTALEQLRDLSARREADLTVLREQLRADQSAQRLTVIQQILPVLDGLNEALTAGKRLLADKPAPEPPPPSTPLTPQQRIAFVLGRYELPTVTVTQDDAWRESVAAWLDGIELVRARLRQTLAAEGVKPIDALGELFDPHRHIAIETVPATSEIVPGTIVEEYRQGYQIGERILRASEVVVAK